MSTNNYSKLSRRAIFSIFRLRFVHYWIPVTLACLVLDIFSYCLFQPDKSTIATPDHIFFHCSGLLPLYRTLNKCDPIWQNPPLDTCALDPFLRAWMPDLAYLWINAGKLKSMELMRLQRQDNDHNNNNSRNNHVEPYLRQLVVTINWTLD